MRILNAKDYGYRVVITVWHNPEEPPIIHPIGVQLRDGDGQPLFDDAGIAVIINSSVPEPGCTLELCHNARNNRRTTEHIFEGETLYTLDKNGNKRRKVRNDFLADIRRLCPVVKPVANKASWIGMEV